jgi:polysaccharide biosynthesis transport protein
MPDPPRIPNGTNRELVRVSPRVQSRIGAPVAGDFTRGGLKREYAGVLEYWQMVRRHKMAVAAFAVLGAAGGFLYTLPQARFYQAHTTIEVQGFNEDFLGLHNANQSLSPTNTYYPDLDIQTQVKILQSRTLIQSVVEDLRKSNPPENLRPPDRLTAWKKALGIAPPTPEQLWSAALGSAAGSVRVRAMGTNRIVDITCDSTQPGVAAAFANTLTKEFIEQNLEARWKSTEFTGEWLTRQLQDIKVKLEKDDEALNSYATATGLTFTDDKTNAADDKLRDLQKQVLAAQAERVARQSKYDMTKESPPDALPDMLDDASLRAYETSLTDLRKQFAQLRIGLTPQHADVRRVEAQITLLESAIQTERANILTRIKNEYEAARHREDLINSSYLAQVKLVADQAEKATHYGILKHEVESTRSLYDTMLLRLKEASVASALHASNIRVVDPAESPQVPFKPNVYRFIFMGWMAGIGLGVGLVVLRERADRTLHDPGDTAYYLHLPELGVVPTASLDLQRIYRVSRAAAEDQVPDDRVEVITWTHKSAMISESFRTALTSILFCGQNGERPRVIVLSSASLNEGKTTVASNLAIAVAEINQKVLIIDADLRRPRMHQVFGIKNDEHGLSDLLLRQVPLDEATLRMAVHATYVPNLYLMPSGRSRFNAASLLHSQRLPELLRSLREQFDTILIDTPPMINIPDARVMGRLADGVILILRSALTTRDAALLAKQRFVDDGIPVMGTILNNWNPNTPGYGYYRDQYAGFYYGDGNENGKGQGPGSAAGKNGRARAAAV